jgi:electron transport complex protein RnfG
MKAKTNYILDAWLVILLAILYGAGLAAVQMGLGPKIAENIKNETYAQIPQLIPGANAGKTQEVPLELKPGKQTIVFHAFSEQGEPMGWVIPANGLGFADKILLLVGVTEDLEKLTGLYVLDQKETPGLGNYITEKPFTGQFVGLSATQPLQVVKMDAASDQNQVTAVTGATISSVSVATIVNQALTDFRSALTSTLSNHE